MPADSSSADASSSEEVQSKSCCLSRLLCLKSQGGPARDSRAPKSNADAGKHKLKHHKAPKKSNHNGQRVSVYATALENGNLTPAELAAIKELEEAAGGPAQAVSNHGNAGGEGRESIYVDASEHLVDDWDYLMAYMPATVPNTHRRASLTFERPMSLLVRPPAGSSAGTAKTVSKKEVTSSGTRRRLSSIVGQLKKPAVRVDLRGYPGELTEGELESCQRFRAELDERSGGASGDGDDTDDDGNGNNKLHYREIVDALHTVEEEPYALCRFLRARKFDVEASLEMVGEGVEVWKEGKRNDFYPDPNIAVGAPISVFRTQYPMLYSGIAKNGCPVSYFRAGQVSVEGLECVTTLARLSNLAWHQLMYNFPSQIAKAQAVNPDVVRCESMAILDLKGLYASSINARTLEVLKAMLKINLCFPEILNCMIILNAPTFFSFSWRIIKKFIDPRTAAKITIFTDAKKGIQCLHSRIDDKELLSDYGGDGESFETVMQTQGDGVAALRRIVRLLTIPQLARKEIKFDLAQGETFDVRVFTRSVAGADISLFKDNDNAPIKEVRLQSTVAPSGEGEFEPEPEPEPEPYCTDIASGVEGPGTFRLVAEAKSESSIDHFLLVCRVFD